MTDKNNELTIKFTGERKVFFTSKKPAGDSTAPTTTNAQILSPPPMTSPPIAPTAPPQQQPTAQIKSATSPSNQSQPPSRPFARFTNSSIGSSSQAPVVVSPPPTAAQTPQTQAAKRQKLPDEVPFNFDVTKYKVVNPAVKFEYRRTLIECKLGTVDREEGEILAVFIGPDFKESKEIKRLSEVCEYDIAKCIVEAKPKNGKVIPLTSKSFGQFEGLFFVYLEERPTKADYVDAMRNLLQQVDESEIEEICVPVIKSKLFGGTAEELANTIIDETTAFLSNRSRENRPTQISWIQIVTDEPSVFAELTKVYCEAIEKVSGNTNLVIAKGYSKE